MTLNAAYSRLETLMIEKTLKCFKLLYAALKGSENVKK